MAGLDPAIHAHPLARRRRKIHRGDTETRRSTEISCTTFVPGPTPCSSPSSVSCMSRSRCRSRIGAAGADGSPIVSRPLKAATELGAPSVIPSNPNSRSGRKASPHLQGRGKMEDLFVGIDVSKDRLDVHIQPTGEAFAVARDGKGLAELAERLTAMAPRLVVVEATGGYEITVSAAVAGAGLPLAVVNPRQIRSYAHAIGRLAKTDKLDAEVIAKFAEAVKPEPRPLPSEEAQALGEMVARRRQLIEMIVAETNRRRHLTQRRLVKGVDRHLEVLQKALTELDKDIGDEIRGSPA